MDSHITFMRQVSTEKGVKKTRAIKEERHIHIMNQSINQSNQQKFAS